MTNRFTIIRENVRGIVRYHVVDSVSGVVVGYFADEDNANECAARHNQKEAAHA